MADSYVNYTCQEKAKFEAVLLMRHFVNVFSEFS